MLVIVLSSIKLIYDTYIEDLPETDPMVSNLKYNSILQVDFSGKFDYVFTIFFAIEMLLKWIAFGVVQDRNSYLRETWNQLDCFIVWTSLIDASLTNVNLPVIKILRILRILRPLRFISHNSSMKTLVVALIQSLGSIFNVGVVILVIFVMFAILGSNLF